MSDIVKQLTAMSVAVELKGVKVDGALLAGAADEIERLNALLAEAESLLRAELNYRGGSYCNADDIEKFLGRAANLRDESL